MHVRYRNSIRNKETKKKLFMHKNVFTLPVSFTGSYSEDEPNFPWKNNVILQKRVPGINKVVNFKEFSRPNWNAYKYFSRTKTEFKDFLRRLQTYKTFSRLYKPYHKYNAFTASKLSD